MEDFEKSRILYTPAHFKESNIDSLVTFVDKNSFGTLISCIDNSVSNISKSAFIIEKIGNEIVLSTHLAKSNPHLNEIENNEVTVIFDGPHGYISPTTYQEKEKSVPTWNYTTVIGTGEAKKVDDKSKLLQQVFQLIQKYEKNDKYKERLDQKYIDKMLNGIIGIEIKLKKIQGKFKLSQNKSEMDISSVIENLENNLALKEEMRHYYGSKKFFKKTVKSYEICYLDPLFLKIGDNVSIIKSEPEDSEWFGWHFCKDNNGKEGWISLDYISIENNQGHVQKNYSAKELSANKGQNFEIILESYGWYWCKSEIGELGWLPVIIFEENKNE